MNLVLWGISVYQRNAPTGMRAACRFTPTCSEYMRLAILKYGTIGGVVKGVGRVLRCKSPNGGLDLP